MLGNLGPLQHMTETWPTFTDMKRACPRYGPRPPLNLPNAATTSAEKKRQRLGPACSTPPSAGSAAATKTERWWRFTSAGTHWRSTCWHSNANLDALTGAGIFLPLLDSKPPHIPSKNGRVIPPPPPTSSLFPPLTLLCTIHHRLFSS